MQITDGRKRNGIYQQELIDWFDSRSVDTGIVLVDTIRQRAVQNRKGDILRYRVTWKQLVRSNDGGYLTYSDGDLVTNTVAMDSRVPVPG